LLIYPHEAEWILFFSRYSQKLIAREIEPEISETVARNPDYYTTEAV
jgi:hypothetical protein